jgi:ABC-type multidrug transport system ATPase subunit
MLRGHSSCGGGGSGTSSERARRSSRFFGSLVVLLFSCFLSFVLLLSGVSCNLELASILPETQDTIGEFCKDERLKIVLKSICEPDGSVAQAIESARDATVAMEALEVDSATSASSNGYYLPPSQVRFVQEGDKCIVNTRDIALFRTNDLHLESAEGLLAAEESKFIKSTIDELTLDVAQYIKGLSGDEASEVEKSLFENDGSTYTVFSKSSEMCSAGLQCVIFEADSIEQEENSTLAGDEIGMKGLSLQGSCVKCKGGKYCPAGVANDETGLFLFSASVMNVCPQGYFCESPSSIKDCPEGLFCPPGSSKPLDCNDLGFNITYYNGGDPVPIAASLDGNYCPFNSVSPWGLCPARYYCPNATVAIECPSSYYCPAMSEEPSACPILSHCPAGSAAPSTSWLALIGIVAVCLVVYGLSFLIIWCNRTPDEPDEGEEQSAKYNDKIVKTICRLVLPEYKARDISDVFKMGSLSHVSDPLKTCIKGLTVNFKQRTILHKVDITIPKGTLNAIFGPSGSGKTTLIKSMLGKLAYNLNVDGEVSYLKCTSKEKIVVYTSGRSILGKARDFFETSRARKKVIKEKVGYVPQDNVVYQNLTVFENILFSVKLRNKAAGNRKELTDQILNLLGLFSVRNTVVGSPEKGGISGGECRRVSIGLELAGSPLCLILDEPTTGLDAVSADRVLKCLNFLTESGMTIIASIHQPKSSIYHLFDMIHVLMKGGFVVYSGPKNYLTKYFAHVGFVMPGLENPADFIIDIVSGLVNCKSNASFTTEDLPQMWIDNKSILDTYSSKNLKTDRQSITRKASEAELSNFAQTRKMLQATLDSLQETLSSHPVLNTGTDEYQLEIDELKDLVMQICSACCHLQYFRDLSECVSHMATKIVSLLSPEGENSTQDAEGEVEEEANSLRSPSMKRLLSMSSSLQNLKSIRMSCNPKRTFKLLYILMTKDMLGWVRSLGLKTVDILTTAIFAVILAFNQGAGLKNVQDILYMSMLSNLYVGMLSIVWAITLTLGRLKSAEREAGGSISTALIFSSASCANLVDHILRPTIYSILFYFIALPRMSFGEFYLVILGVALSCSGLGDLIAVIFPESLATVAGLIIAFAFGGLLNGFSPPLADLPSPWIVFPSYARWGIEALCLAEFKQYNDWRTTTGMIKVGYSFSNWKWAILWLYSSAVVFRLLAYPFFRRKALN